MQDPALRLPHDTAKGAKPHSASPRSDLGRRRHVSHASFHPQQVTRRQPSVGNLKLSCHSLTELAGVLNGHHVEKHAGTSPQSRRALHKGCPASTVIRKGFQIFVRGSNESFLSRSSCSTKSAWNMRILRVPSSCWRVICRVAS